MKRVGIIGAGRFAMALAQTLAESGEEVLLVEKDGALVQNALSVVGTAVQGDATDRRTLEEAGIGECDVAVVAMGSNIEASVMATANCKDLGIKKVVAKASSELHGRILEKLGADSVIYPDREAARRLARSITHDSEFDLLEISAGCSVAEIDVPESCRGKTLAEANVRNKTGVTVLCILRVAENAEKPRTVIIPGADEKMLPDDKLVVFGTPRQIDGLLGN